MTIWGRLKAFLSRPVVAKVRWALGVVGLFACLNCVLIGLAGVILGHSIQSYWAICLAVIGFWLVLVMPSPILRRSIATAILLYVIGLHVMMVIQSDLYLAGGQYYREQRYGEALSKFRAASATEKWYWRVNAPAFVPEGYIQYDLGRTFYELGNYEKAIDCYRLVLDRYIDTLPDGYRTRTNAALERTEAKLEERR